MSDYARFKNIEPMYKAKISQLEALVKALKEKIRLLESGETNQEIDIFIDHNSVIYEAEIVEDEEWIGPGHDPSGNQYD